MDKNQLLRRLRELKNELRSRFTVKTFALFGSYARGEQTSESDIDLFVEFERPVGIEFVELIIYLEGLFGKPVDLVTKNGLNNKLKPFVGKDLIYV